jgi:hypothetical protein
VIDTIEVFFESPAGMGREITLSKPPLVSLIEGGR